MKLTVIVCMLVTAARADYQMELCGTPFAACEVKPTMEYAGTTDPPALIAALDAFYPLALEPGQSLHVLVLGETKAGWIGFLDASWSYPELMFFPMVSDPNSWSGPVYMGEPYLVWPYDMNDQGLAVGAYMGGSVWSPVEWSQGGGGSGPQVFSDRVIPDPRLKDLGIDPKTFDVTAGSFFYAINDKGEIGACCARGVSYELKPVPEGSSLVLVMSGVGIMLLLRTAHGFGVGRRLPWAIRRLRL